MNPVSDGELTGRPALLPGESIIVESVGETNWPLIFIFWAMIAGLGALFLLPSGLTAMRVVYILVFVILAGGGGYLVMRREARNKALIITSQRVMVGGGTWQQTWSIYEWSRMKTPRMYYDGGLLQAAGVANIEFDLDGRRESFQLTRSQRVAIEPLLGFAETPGALGGLLRRRVSESESEEPPAPPSRSPSSSPEPLTGRPRPTGMLDS